MSFTSNQFIRDRLTDNRAPLSLEFQRPSPIHFDGTVAADLWVSLMFQLFHMNRPSSESNTINAQELISASTECVHP